MELGQELGPFAIEKEIGSGAMGTVYRGRHTSTGQPVAIKVISGGYDANPTALARFEREANILKQLSHPNIVRLIATGRWRKTPFYVMEFVSGESLETLLQRRGRFTWEEVVNLGQQVCEALKHAHAESIVHRDIKPANIMMTPEGVVKLTDFGIAKGLESVQLTATNCTVGTASYMSPEQCRGEPNLTHKSDLYSLGVVFYELLTGHRPFTADTTLKMFLAHTEGKFERPSRHVMDIPVWLDTLVCQLMEKEPSKRPMDAATVSRALHEIVDKVAAQRSAGVDVVTARRIDVPKSRRLKGEADREAARLLREATGKKKIKRQTPAIYERAWFQAAAIAGLLAAVGGMVWYVMRPAKAEDLFNHARSYMTSADPNDWDKARQGPIADYLKHYGNRADSQTEQMRTWADQADVHWRERQLQNRMRLGVKPENEAESTAHNAVRAEEAGELSSAMARWESLLRYKDEKEGELRPWGLLAAKRLKEINDAEQQEQQLRELVAQLRRRADTKAADGADVFAVAAIRAEMFGDHALALERWKALKTGAPGDSDRALRLLALRKAAELDQKVPRGVDIQEKRRGHVKEKLDAAAELQKENGQEAQAICRDIIALYERAGDAELRPLVSQARALLAED
jgi:serine/threonine-protein kinase